ncbi:MAG: class I SAM-dependent methyltransferase [Thermodesulfobacteriota bacterium]
MGPRFSLKAREHLGTAGEKRRFNALHFEEAARRYDIATKAMSLGCDPFWKRRLVDSLPDLPSPVCVDLACGTGDLSFLLAGRYPRGSVAGVDLVPAMLSLARGRNRHPNVRFVRGDMCALPFPDGCADIVTGGYALRNAPDLKVALAEIRRVLKDGAVAAFLDFCRPEAELPRRIQYRVLRSWCGLWGRILHGTFEVHGYVADSLERFPGRRRFREILEEEGFLLAGSHRFFPGTTELLVLRRAERRPPPAVGV